MSDPTDRRQVDRPVPHDRRSGDDRRHADAPVPKERRKYTKRPKMACPVCGRRQSTVLPKQAPESTVLLWRYRSCDYCGLIFSTQEIVVGTYPKPDLT